MSASLKKIITDTGNIKISLSIIFILAITFTLNQTLDASSKVYVDKAFDRALISFGIAKTLNGVISVAQGTEVAIQPAGIGINLTPGQILDPINDLVERFSWIMLMSTTSLGIQKIFLAMSIWPAFSYFLVFILTFGLLLLFTKTRKYFHLRIFILRTSLIFIVLRFAVPITGLANQGVYHVFLEKEYVASTKRLENTAEEIGELNKNNNFNQPNIRKKSVWENAKEYYKSTSEILDINKKIEMYKQTAKETTHHIINLIVVFIFQTIIIPLTFIFILYLSLKFIIKLNFRH